MGEGEGGAVGGGPGLRGGVFRGGGFGRWFWRGFGGFVEGRKGGFDFHGEEVVGEFFDRGGIRGVVYCGRVVLEVGLLVVCGDGETAGEPDWKVQLCVIGSRRCGI